MDNKVCFMNICKFLTIDDVKNLSLIKKYNHYARMYMQINYFWKDVMNKNTYFDNLFIFEMANNHIGNVDHGLNIIRELYNVCKVL